MEPVEIIIINNGTDKVLWFVRPDGSLCQSLNLVTDEGQEVLEEV